jgi:hypothetical protein
MAYLVWCDQVVWVLIGEQVWVFAGDVKRNATILDVFDPSLSHVERKFFKSVLWCMLVADQIKLLIHPDYVDIRFTELASALG